MKVFPNGENLVNAVNFEIKVGRVVLNLLPSRIKSFRFTRFPISTGNLEKVFAPRKRFSRSIKLPISCGIGFLKVQA